MEIVRIKDTTWRSSVYSDPQYTTNERTKYAKLDVKRNLETRVEDASASVKHLIQDPSVLYVLILESSSMYCGMNVRGREWKEPLVVHVRRNEG